MTQTLTTDQIDQVIEDCRKGAAIRGLFNKWIVEEMASELLRCRDRLAELSAVANREAQPVGFYTTVSGRKGVVWHNGTPEDDTAIYTAPPALGVPRVTSIPDAATLTNINQLCPMDSNLSQTDFSTGWNDCRQYALTHEGLPPVIKGVHAAAQGWNDCRAAMLAQPVSQGYKLVPLEPTQEMCNVQHIGVDVYTGMANDGEYYSIGGSDAAKVYRAMLAAAPEGGK